MNLKTSEELNFFSKENIDRLHKEVLIPAAQKLANAIDQYHHKTRIDGGGNVPVSIDDMVKEAEPMYHAALEFYEKENSIAYLNYEHYYTGGLLYKTCDNFDLFKLKSPNKETTNMDKEVLRTVFPDDVINLEVLAEEASEIIQAKSKIIRFGLNDSFNETIRPDQTNKQKLETEVFQFLAVVDVLVARGIIDTSDMETVKQAKWEKMAEWNAYEGTKGTEGDLF